MFDRKIEFNMNAPFIDGDVITGEVVNTTTTNTFQTDTGKAVAFFADSTPYQFPHQYARTAITVKPIHTFGDPNEQDTQRCLIFEGDLVGSIDQGNRIVARVKLRRGQLYVREMVNATTNSAVRPTAQIGGALAVALILAPFALAAILLFLLVRAISDGSLATAVAGGAEALIAALLSLCAGILSAVGPSLVVILGIYLLIRCVVK